MGTPVRQLAPIFSGVAALGCVVIAVAFLRETGSGDVSSLRLTGIALMTLAAAWFAIATFSPRLARLNIIALVNVVLILSGVELLLRFMVNRLPISVVRLLPDASRGPILRDRGHFTVDTLQGSGLL